MDERKNKNKDERKNTFCKKYIENGRLESDFLLEKLITERKDLTLSTKTLYYENLAKKVK